MWLFVTVMYDQSMESEHARWLCQWACRGLQWRDELHYYIALFVLFSIFISLFAIFCFPLFRSHCLTMGILSSLGHDVIVSGLVMAVMASVAICLRFIAKNMTKSGVRADDYWALVGLLLFWAYVGVMLWGTYAKLFTKNQANGFQMQGCLMVQMEPDRTIWYHRSMMKWKCFS